MVESALYILAGIAFYGGGHQLYLGAQRTPDHPHIIHGVMYLLLCAFALTSAQTFQSHSVATLVSTGKLGVSAGLMLWATLAWFVAACTRFKPRLLLAALTAAWSLLLIGNIGAPFSLLYSEVTPLRQALPDGQLQVTLHTVISPWWMVVQLAMLTSLLFALYASFRLYRSDEKPAALALGSGLLVLLGASVSDALVNAGQVQSAYLAPFGFLVLLISASVYPTLQAARKVPRGEEPPANYNMTFHLNQPPHNDSKAFAQPPVQEPSAAGIVHVSQAEIAHKKNRRPLPLAPIEMPDAVSPQMQAPPHKEAAHRKPGRPHEVQVQAEPEAPAATREPRLDEAALTEVSDNLIDIAVYATMAMNRFKRGDANAETLEALFRKVRAQAISTRRIANRMMHPQKDPHGGTGEADREVSSQETTDSTNKP